MPSADRLQRFTQHINNGVDCFVASAQLNSIHDDVKTIRVRVVAVAHTKANISNSLPQTKLQTAVRVYTIAFAMFLCMHKIHIIWVYAVCTTLSHDAGTVACVSLLLHLSFYSTTQNALISLV